MVEEYERKLRAFFAASPEPETLRTFLEGEDLDEILAPVGIIRKRVLVYWAIAVTRNDLYMDVFFSFRPNILDYLASGSYGIIEWIKGGKSGYFASLFRHFKMEELRWLIDLDIDRIIRSGYQDIFDLLAENGYLVESNMSQLLRTAIQSKKVHIVDILLHEGAKVEPIHFTTAVFSRDIGIIQRMMMYGGNVNSRDPKGDTPLSMSFMSEDVDVIREILGYGADVNTISLMYEYSPLMLAIGEAALHPLVKDLIDAGANVNYRTSHGETALSVTGDNEEIRALLIAAGATDRGITLEEIRAARG